MNSSRVKNVLKFFGPHPDSCEDVDAEIRLQTLVDGVLISTSTVLIGPRDLVANVFTDELTLTEYSIELAKRQQRGAQH